MGAVHPCLDHRFALCFLATRWQGDPRPESPRHGGRQWRYAVCSRIVPTTVSQSCRLTPWPAPSSRSRRAPAISSASASPCSVGNIGSAVPWMTRAGHGYRRERLARAPVVRDRAVVLKRREVAGSLDIPTYEISSGVFIERALPLAPARRRPGIRSPNGHRRVDAVVRITKRPPSASIPGS